VRLAPPTDRTAVDEESSMDPLPSDPELFASIRDVLAENRRARAERDALWNTHLEERERVNGHCLSFLDEARARLDARHAGRAGHARNAIDRPF